MRRFVTDNYPLERLPRELHPGLPADRRVRVIIEDEITDEDLREERDRMLQEGLDDLAAGRVHPAEEVFAQLRAKYRPKITDAAE